MWRTVRGTAEEATRRELWWSSVHLLLWLVMLLLLLVPLVRELPLGVTGRSGIIAWLLVAAALFWLYRGLGYRALLLLQLALFSAAASLLTVKAVLVALGVPGFGIVREVARVLLVVGGVCAGANLGAMLVALLRGRPTASPTPRRG